MHEHVPSQPTDCHVLSSIIIRVFHALQAVASPGCNRLSGTLGMERQRKINGMVTKATTVKLFNQARPLPILRDATDAHTTVTGEASADLQ